MKVLLAAPGRQLSGRRPSPLPRPAMAGRVPSGSHSHSERPTVACSPAGRAGARGCAGSPFARRVQKEIRILLAGGQNNLTEK